MRVGHLGYSEIQTVDRCARLTNEELADAMALHAAAVRAGETAHPSPEDIWRYYNTEEAAPMEDLRYGVRGDGQSPTALFIRRWYPVVLVMLGFALISLGLAAVMIRVASGYWPFTEPAFVAKWRP